MQPVMMSQDSNGFSERHLTHRRLERWIRLQQFVYGLPDDFSYAVCLGKSESGSQSRALVSVGWMSWYGRGDGADPQHALAVALLESSEALSANARATLLHNLKQWLLSQLRFLRLTRKARAQRLPVEQDSRLMAS